jgi:hypothetical protein
MNLQAILDEILTLAAIILPFAGLPAYAGLIAALLPKIDALIQGLTNTLSQANEWTPEQQAAFQQRIDALKADPAWQVTP